MAESDDARASARRHTSQLLKMLRGYGAPAAPAATTPGKPAGVVAEAAPGYARRPEPVPSRQDAQNKVSRSSESPMVSPQRVAISAIPTVGEALSRQRGPLGELMARADRLVRLSRIFRAYLPPHLRDHAVLIRLDEGEWVVHADSSSWATRLRYALHNIRETLGQELGFALPKPHIRVVPAALPPPPRPPMTLTQRNAKLLEVTARNLSDERLSAALRRLAAYADPAREAPERGG